jgi:hypothetical protein
MYSPSFDTSKYRFVGSGHLQDHRTDVESGDRGNVRALRSELRFVVLGPTVQGTCPDPARRSPRTFGRPKFGLLHAQLQ